MARQIKFTKEDVEKIIEAKKVKGIPVKEYCRQHNMKYVSIMKAIKRYGLVVPRTYANVRNSVEVKSDETVETKEPVLA